jgi:hypothetical protein
MKTRDEILNMPAGQGMDLLMADDVLKLSVSEWNERFFHNRSKFSTDMAAAWQVVEKVSGEWLWFGLFKTASLWKANFTGNENDYAFGETAPLAICRAAYLAELSG